MALLDEPRRFVGAAPEPPDHDSAANRPAGGRSPVGAAVGWERRCGAAVTSGGVWQHECPPVPAPVRLAADLGPAAGDIAYRASGPRRSTAASPERRPPSETPLPGNRGRAGLHFRSEVAPGGRTRGDRCAGLAWLAPQDAEVIPYRRVGDGGTFSAPDQVWTTAMESSRTCEPRGADRAYKPLLAGFFYPLNSTTVGVRDGVRKTGCDTRSHDEFGKESQ